MNAEELSATAKARIADVLPDAVVAALSLYDPSNKKNPQLYRLRLLSRSVQDEVCQFGHDPETALDRFEKAVRKSLKPRNPFA